MKSNLRKGLCAVAIGTTLGWSAMAEAETLSLGATNATSSHYQIAVAMAKAIETENEGTTVTVVETGASVDNIKRLVRGEIDLGLVAGDVFIQALTGTGKFEGHAVDDLVALYPYSTSIINVAVRQDSGITNLQELDEKNFTPGIRGSGGEALISAAFELFEIEPNYIYGTVTDAKEGVANGQLVGYSKYAAANRVDAALQELMTSTDMRLLGFNAEQQALIKENIAGVGFMEVPAGFIEGNDAFSTPAVPIVYATRKSLMDNATAERIARGIGENTNILIETWPQLADYDFRASILETQGIGIAVHPGALDYWQQ
ncbi:TAXI family TRAP transporter solute-binding subunit [uncultured Roseovarius sp.]|uniref:TAXI family TRAP transporter solute-binding subunit n=1 Tax=uncultured Roseovarius sp. TaxID=293344 RepID=UPI00260AF881|nr:TAXI family TRAP transporter solute-binding subunit [uncultured Roseovarius sp.]